MSKRYDKVIKEILKDVADTLITKVIGLKIVKSTALETKLQVTNEREADFIFRVELEDGSVFLLHIEFQSTNYFKMEYRMLRYWVYLTEIYGIAPMQYVFYIGNEPLTMKNSIATETTAHRYNLIDMRDVDCGKFLNSDRPEEVIISILCNYQKKGVKIFIREILNRLNELVQEETLRGKYVRQVEVLSQLRDLQNEVSEEAENMAIAYDMERDVRFRQGRERGMLEGIEKGVEKGIKKGIAQGMLEGIEKGIEKGLTEAIELALDIRFGAEGVALMDKINNITDVGKLKQIKEHLRKAKTIAEVIEVINS
ncbi:hypothetical protein [Candidatus Magnetominusculus dajiuhuensis]|uniref:hypothetical protein n=1 Tax=Candidatus Magnetominusculus dajiuhuensis TaxID=3137712 RepID=UPI003B42838E